MNCNCNIVNMVQCLLLLQDSVEHALVVVILPCPPGVYTLADKAQNQFEALATTFIPCPVLSEQAGIDDNLSGSDDT